MLSNKCFCQNDEDLPNAKILQATFSDVRRHYSYDLCMIDIFDIEFGLKSIFKLILFLE